LPFPPADEELIEILTAKQSGCWPPSIDL